jgi:hypothetical protein
MNLLWLIPIAGGGAAAVGLLVAGLTALANRTRKSSRDTGPVTEPVKHTEEERAALWAELAPEPQLSRRERVAARALHRRSLIVARQISDDIAVLDSAERGLHGGLDALWKDACTSLGVGESDVDWSLLAAGELVDA